MSEKIKPCPFCLGEGKIKKIGNEHCKKMQVKIECSTRGCFAYQQCSTLVKFGGRSWEYLIEQATVAWNHRTPDPALTALKSFARKTIQADCWDMVPLDGFDIQDLALELGLIERHAETEMDIDVDGESDVEVGDVVYNFTDILKETE